MFVVHRAARGHDLVRGLADLLRDPPDDPFTPDVVAVPAAGVERWLAQRLSHVLGAGPDGDDGVCAHVRLTRTPALVEQVLATASPPAAEDAAAWDAGRTRWLVRELRDVDVATATRLAALLAGYERARPQMVTAWAAGDDTDGTGEAVPPDLAWQPALWRALRARIGVPSPAEHLDGVCAAIRDHAGRLDLPDRLSLYGPTRLSASRLRLLDALAEQRDVHLWIHHPSPARWAAEQARDSVLRRVARPDPDETGHPLLDSMARDVAELHDALRQHTTATDAAPPDDPRPPTTLLARLQADLHADRLPQAPTPVDADDRSVQVHACHGRTRQVEVLREVVLGLLADDPTLEPRDVLVMCPDVEAFAPAVAAAFDQSAHPDQPDDGRTHPASRLRITLADRAPAQTNPLLGLLADVLGLATSRITAADVLDLAARPAVRLRHGLSVDDVERLRTWVESAGIRWGLDADHRAEWDLPLADGTWRQGLDRLVLGAAVDVDPALPEPDATSPVVRHDGAVLTPADDVDGTDLELLGRLSTLVDVVAEAHAFVRGRHDLDTWVDGLATHLAALAAVPPADAWFEVQLDLELDALRETAPADASPLDAADVRAALAPVIAGRPTRTGFRTGSLTFCTLVPMRSVPHRVVCLLGLDDAAFPRQSARDGDDVLARDPWVGERDPRSEDRQLLLDAVLSATETLVVTYAGASETDGSAVPPAVPLAELLDVLDRTASPAPEAPAGTRVRDLVTTHHPLQPFDRRGFAAGALRPAGPFGFDPQGLAGAEATDGERHPPARLLETPLDEPSPADVTLDDLVRLLTGPAAALLRTRLDIGRASDEEEPVGALDLELESLDGWAVGDRLLRRRLRGEARADALDLERGRGTLPPGARGAKALDDVDAKVDRLVAVVETTDLLAVDPVARDVDVRLADGTRLTGTVPGLRGDALLDVTYSRLAAKHRLTAWLRLLALVADDPDHAWSAVTVGRGQKTPLTSRLVAPSADDAHRLLGHLVRLYRHGLSTPLPTPVKTTAAYVERRRRSRDHAARRAAEGEWESRRVRDFVIQGERDDPGYRLLLGPDAPLDALVPTGAWQQDPRVAWVMSQVWRPLIEAEDLR